MVGIVLNDNAYEQDIRELLMAFCPGEEIVHEAHPSLRFCVEGILSEDRTEFELCLVFEGGSSFRALAMEALEPEIQAECRAAWESNVLKVNYEDRFETKNQIKRRLYVLLMEQTGKTLPWGTLTGIRPTKIAMTKLAEGDTPEQVFRYMKQTYFTSNEKINLCIEIAQREEKLLSAIDYRNGYSLYIGIPFCPTTCLYCSFTSYPIGRWQGRTGEYFQALFKEMDYVAEKKKGCTLDTVYFGGGTPTSLSPEDLDTLITKLKNTFDFSTVQEFTVEAGRPDSITREKLEVLKKHGVTRISINPQTMKQETLKIIGRRHTVEDVKDRFHMARELGFDNINMDLIVGLPGEDIHMVERTLEQVRELAPDSITVHSLAVKRAARLNIFTEKYQEMSFENNQEIMDLTMKTAYEMGMGPYYLYRQKNMKGNFENVGYAKVDKAGIYNILIMEEKQPIIALGAGGSSKLVFDHGQRIERVENVKDVSNYISRIDEMIERKRTAIATWL